MPDKPSVLYYDLLSYQPENLALLEKEFEVIQLSTPAEDSDEILSQVDACFSPLGYLFDARKIGRCSRLRAIISNTTGVPHIDMEAAASRGIQVFSLKDEQAFLNTITPTAEHAFGLMLALLRRTPWSFGAVLDGSWNRFDFGAPAMLSRLTLGVVGLGRLGKKLAGYGRAFGMQVRYVDPSVEAPFPECLRVEHLEDLLAQSDVVSLHVPANDSTRHMIDHEAFHYMKKSAVLINTSRGEIVDEDALLDALTNNVIAGAATDVLDGEYHPNFQASAHPLVHYARYQSNLLITPHVGGSTMDAWYETQRRVVDMAVDYFSALAGSAP